MHVGVGDGGRGGVEMELQRHVADTELQMVQVLLTHPPSVLELSSLSKACVLVLELGLEP